VSGQLVNASGQLQLPSALMLHASTKFLNHDKHRDRRHGAGCIFLGVAHRLHGFRDASKCSSGTKQLDRSALYVCRGVKVSSNPANGVCCFCALDSFWLSPLEAVRVPGGWFACCSGCVTFLPDAGTHIVNRSGSGELATFYWAWLTWLERSRRTVSTLTECFRVAC
jgi:hypothetical protein